MGGRERQERVRNGVKITQSYQRLAAGKRCNTAENRQTEQRHKENNRDRTESNKDIQTAWLILMMSDFVKSVCGALLTCSRRHLWVMPGFKAVPFQYTCVASLQCYQWGRQRNSAATLISCNINCVMTEVDNDDHDDNVLSLQEASGQTQRNGWWSIS